MFRLPTAVVVVSIACSHCSCSKSETEELPGFPAYQKIILPADRDAAAAWVTATMAAGNPHSDEEPEDFLAQAEVTSLTLFGTPALGLRTAHYGVWTFTPIDQLSSQQQQRVRAWAGDQPTNQPR